MFRNRLCRLIVAAMAVVAIVLSIQRALAAKAIVPEPNLCMGSPRSFFPCGRGPCLSLVPLSTQ